MAFLPRLSHLAAVLPLTAAAVLALASAPACNGSLATVLSSDAGPETSLPGQGNPDGSTSEDGGTATCVANGGMCLGKSVPPAGYRAATAAEGTCETTSPAAKAIFTTEVYPAVSPSCATCHGPGGSGPLYFGGDADTSYTRFKTLGFHLANSPFVSKGQHAGAALTSEQQAAITKWVAAEAAAGSGATCYVPDTSPPAPACVTDQDCNGDSSVSSLMGSCFHGVCICQTPYNVGTNGKCANIKLPDCLSQSGTCRQTPATCLGTEIETVIDPAACGDLVEAVCCTTTAACKGAFDGNTPVDFACCGKAGGSHPPVCLNGWKTCVNGASAILPGTVCK